MRCCTLAKLFFNFLILHLVLYTVAAAPTTQPMLTTTSEMQDGAQTNGNTEVPTNSSSAEEFTTDEVELSSTKNASTPITQEAAPTSPPSPYNCSLNTTAQLNHAIASFKLGWSLIVENLNTNHLLVNSPTAPPPPYFHTFVHVYHQYIDSDLLCYIQQLKSSPTPSSCPIVPLSMLNKANYRSINNRLNSPQAVANTIGKIQAYMTLITMSQSRAYSDTMQALHDLLNGTAKDLYDVVSTLNTYIINFKLHCCLTSCSFPLLIAPIACLPQHNRPVAASPFLVCKPSTTGVAVIWSVTFPNGSHRSSTMPAFTHTSG